jgi:hypothetical protein
MKTAIVSLLLVAALPAAQRPATFTGVITDDMCATAGHSQMQMGPTDADCTRACVSAHGARYVLHDGKDVYALSDQTTPGTFAGQAVRVVGTLDVKTKTIHVDSIAAAK